MDKQRRSFLKVSLCAAASLWCGSTVLARDVKRPSHFLPDERRMIDEYYRRGEKRKSKGLPPGLAKRGGNLPPGLQKHLQKNGQLPPGLQKRLEPLPWAKITKARAPAGHFKVPARPSGGSCTSREKALDWASPLVSRLNVGTCAMGRSLH